MANNFKKFIIYNISSKIGLPLILNRARSLAPNHLKAGIEGKLESTDDSVTIRITASGVDARAWEYGSGIHSRLSKKSKHQLAPKGFIRIKPKPENKTGMLFFFWDKVDSKTPRGSKFRGIASSGKAMFRYVDHPGIEAANNGEGYINLAINKTKKQILDRIRSDGKNAIKLDISAAFKKGKK